jgi:ribonuclease Z
MFRTRVRWRLAVAVCAVAVALVRVTATADGGTDIRVTLLGTGGPPALAHRVGPSILVQAGEERLLVDVGRDVLLRLAQAQVPYRQITSVLFTHLHSDHVAGLPDLWLTGRFDPGRETALEVWGPAGTESMARHLAEAFAFDLAVRRRQTPEQGVLNGHDVHEGLVFDRHGVRVSAFTVDHGSAKPAVGYRIQYRDRSVVLSGDTAYSEHLIEWAKGADLVIHEVAAMSPGDPDTARMAALHTSPEDAGKVFARIRPKMAVYSHVLQFGVTDADTIARTRTTYQGPLMMGEDLMSFDVGATVTAERPTRQ